MSPKIMSGMNDRKMKNFRILLCVSRYSLYWPNLNPSFSLISSLYLLLLLLLLFIACDMCVCMMCGKGFMPQHICAGQKTAVKLLLASHLLRGLAVLLNASLQSHNWFLCTCLHSNAFSLCQSVSVPKFLFGIFGLELNFRNNF